MAVVPSSMISSSNFNSIKVRLKHRCTPASNAADDYFNSIKVRLKQEGENLGGRSRRNFNSIKVRLKLSLFRVLFRWSWQNFNSIKVRLKPPWNYSKLFAVLLFQFHKGTIKTWCTWWWFEIKVYISIP